MNKLLFVVLGLLATLAGYTVSAGRAVQLQSLPGSVAHGEQVLREKRCLQCHALKAEGGQRAPDFATLSGEADTPARMAAAIWNHGPRMWSEFQSANLPVPSLSLNDVSDVFSYFFAILYFEPHGNSTRGRSVFIQKNCISCHSEVLNPQALDPFLSRWMQLRDPSRWAERLWNHASEMDSATAVRSVKWPELSARDVADLMLFFSSLPDVPSEGPAFNIGEPMMGKVVFESSCESCHSLGAGDKSKIDLLKRSRQTSVAGYVAAMWNHAPKMRRRGEGALPKLDAGEMQDVIAYLFLMQYFYEEGNVTRGRRIYESKGCAGCHEGARATGAPDLTTSVHDYTPITIAAALWRHGPRMEETLRQQGKGWPRLDPSEVTDLLTYMNSLVKPQIAR